jgi:molecular chaperone Hsp33
MEQINDNLQTDFLRPFGVEGTSISGHALALGSALDTIIVQHDYPDSVSNLLAQLLALTALLYGSFKFKGILTLQIKGDGPLDLLVCDVDHEGALRGYAHFDEAIIKSPTAPAMDLKALVGEGYLLLVVDPDEGDRYQGVVELTGPTLVACVEHYFTQSVQHPTKIALAVGFPILSTGGEGGSQGDRLLPKESSELQGSGWRAGAVMIQQHSDGVSDEGLFHQWEEALCHMETIASSELLAGGLLGLDRLLYKLFHEHGVRVHQPQAVKARCRCSQEKIQRAVDQAMGSDPGVEEKRENALVTCEFCGKVYTIKVSSDVPVLEE